LSGYSGRVRNLIAPFMGLDEGVMGFIYGATSLAAEPHAWSRNGRTIGNGQTRSHGAGSGAVCL
jgi:hypothetical protein